MSTEDELQYIVPFYSISLCFDIKKKVIGSTSGAIERGNTGGNISEIILIMRPGSDQICTLVGGIIFNKYTCRFRVNRRWVKCTWQVKNTKIVF